MVKKVKIEYGNHMEILNIQDIKPMREYLFVDVYKNSDKITILEKVEVTRNEIL